MDVAELRERRARGMMRAVKNTAEAVAGDAQRRAPVDEGTLRASAEVAFIVDGHRFDGDNAYEAALAAAVVAARAGVLRRVEADVSFNTVYAARQHEETEWIHPKGGEAKYLESAMREQAPNLRRALELEDRIAGFG